MAAPPSIILCLQNNLGEDTPIPVEPGDDFHTFMENARSILGKDVDISTITGGEEVSLTDNFHQFILHSQLIVNSEIDNPADMHNFTIQPQQLLVADNELVSNQNDEEIVYVLSDGQVFYGNDDCNEIFTYCPDSTELQESKNIQQISISEYDDVAENGINNNPDSAIVSAMQKHNLFEIIKDEISHDNVAESKECVVVKRGHSNPPAMKDDIGLQGMSPKDKHLTKKNYNTKSNKCHFCCVFFPFSAFLSYIFDASDQRDMRKVEKTKKSTEPPKIICSACLNRDYTKYDQMPKVLGENDYLVIKNNIQMVYKRVVANGHAKDTATIPKYLNEIVRERDEGLMKEKDPFIVKKEDGNFDIVVEQNIKQSLEENPEIVVKRENVQVIVKEEGPLYCCRLCGLGSNQLPLLHSLEHILNTADQKIFPCVLCEFGFTSYRELEEHMHSDHGNNREDLEVLQRVLSAQVGDQQAGEQVWLDEGTGVFLTVSRKEDQPKTQSTPQFNYQKDEDSDSEGGLWIVQAEDGDADEGTQPITGTVEVLDGTFVSPRMFQCDVCKKRYGSPSRLARHACNNRQQRIRKKPEDPSGSLQGGQYTCPTCQQTFHTKIRLQFHMRHLHCESSVKVLRCSACPDLAFPSEAELYDHIHFAHPRIRQHPCTVEGCTREFLLKASLTTHLRCHAGERSHKCEECGKMFLDRQTLMEHRVTHLKVKPFQCHICLKYLNRRSRLRMHLLTHQSEPIAARLLACTHCHMAFKDQSQAEQHINDAGECPENTEINVDEPTIKMNINTDENLNEAIKISPIETFPNNHVIPLDALEDVQPRNGVHLVQQNIMLSGRNGSEIILERLNFYENGWRQDLSQDLVLNSTDKDLLDKLSDSLKSCMTIVELDKAYRCEYCERVYSSQQSLNLHRGSHQGLAEPFICHVCGASFTTYSRCTTHKTTHGFYRSKHSPPIYDSFPVVKHFLCEVCGKSYLHWTYLQVHRRQKHSDNVHMYKCHSCGDEFPNSWGIAYHRKKVHGQRSGSAPTGELVLPAVEKFHYSCPDCGIVLKTKAQLFLHRRSEHPPPSAPPKQGMYSCAQCDKRYITKIGLKGHMKTHEEKPLKDKHHHCQECGKIFAHATGLNTHTRRVHMRETNFSCVQCDKAFYSASDLQSHARRHTGERPFPCEACGRCFRTKGMRNEHLRIHTGERPFPCTVCGLAFRRPYALKSHLLIHQGGRKHTCPACARPFRLRAELNTHLRHTHGLEPVVENKQKETFAQYTPEQNPETILYTEGGEEIVIFNENGIETSEINNSMEINSSIANEEMTLKTHECSGSNSMLQNDVEIYTAIFDDGRIEYENKSNTIEINDAVFLQDEDVVVSGEFILNDSEEIIGELNNQGTMLVVQSNNGIVDEKIGSIVNEESDGNGDSVMEVGKEMECERYDDIMLKGGEFGGDWRTADASKSPDDTRRFNDLFRSHQ